MSHKVCTVCKNSWIFNDDEICNLCKKKKESIVLITKMAKSGIDLESILGNVSEVMINNRVKLDDVQINNITNAYYLSGEKNTERLDNAGILFQQLHHNNEMILS